MGHSKIDTGTVCLYSISVKAEKVYNFHGAEFVEKLVVSVVDGSSGFKVEFLAAETLLVRPKKQLPID